MATFIGPRNDNFDLVDDIDITPTLEVFDDIGGKRANVYRWTKRKGFEDQWEQFLPTPHIQYLEIAQELKEGGIGTSVQVMLKNIPVSLYSEGDLETAVEDETALKKYWVLSGPGLEPKAYTTKTILKRNPILFDVTLEEFDSINSSDIIIPGEEDMGLNQAQVDNRIIALVAKGALKTATPADRDHFVFSKSFNLTFPDSDERVALSLSTDKKVLYADLVLLTNPPGEVPNILSKENGGGPWGIRFDDAEVSFDGLEFRANEQANWDGETQECNLKYIWETWVGASTSNLNKVASVERYHHDFDSNEGFDIDMNTFNFMTSLDGDQPVTENLRRMNSATRVVLRLELKRKDENNWNDGLYSVVIHHQSSDFTPYLHDFQFKKSLTV